MLKSNVKINIRPYGANSATKAFVELTLDNTLVIKGLSLVEGRNGLFLSFPASKGKDGRYYNSIYSLDKEFTQNLQDAVLKKYEKVINDVSVKKSNFE